MKHSPLRARPIQAVLGVAVSFASCLSAAHAQTAVSDGSDLAGLTLNMSPEQAQQAILARAPKAKSTKLMATIGTDYYQENMPVGYYVEIEPTSFEQQRGSTDRPGEFVKIINSPNAADMLGILRYKGYAKGSFPTAESVHQGLIQKYGAPAAAGGMGANESLAWVARANVRNVGAGMLSYASPSHCNQTGIGNGPFLYEEAGALFQNGTATFAPGTQVSADTSASFTRVMNEVGKDKTTYATCGLVLQILVRFSENHDYASSILERIVDFDRANAELGKASNAFWAKAEKAKSLKLKGDASKKPDL